MGEFLEEDINLKKIVYLFVSNILLFLIFPIIRLFSKALYEKYILPALINTTCNSRPIDYQRKKVIPEAYGVVLEIGIGPGSNLKHYDSSKVNKIYGIDPSIELNEIARKRANKHDLDIEFLIESASKLSVEDNSIDTVVSTYALCSIPDQIRPYKKLKESLRKMVFLYFLNMVYHPINLCLLYKNQQTFFIPKFQEVVTLIEI